MEELAVGRDGVDEGGFLHDAQVQEHGVQHLHFARRVLFGYSTHVDEALGIEEVFSCVDEFTVGNLVRVSVVQPNGGTDDLHRPLPR